MPVSLRYVARAMAGYFLVFSLLFLGVSSCSLRSLAQSYSRMEIGAQGDAIRLVDPVDSADEKGGFGARVTYNSSPILAWDAEGNFFPSKSPFPRCHSRYASLFPIPRSFATLFRAAFSSTFSAAMISRTR